MVFVSRRHNSGASEESIRQRLQEAKPALRIDSAEGANREFPGISESDALQEVDRLTRKSLDRLAPQP